MPYAHSALQPLDKDSPASACSCRSEVPPPGSLSASGGRLARACVVNRRGTGGATHEPVIRWVVRKFGPDIPTLLLTPLNPLTRIVYPS
ncbi:hypothetical protein MES4922_180030 [Mesorhizobium ventifaucium]|uniref:Uncharacterized protein n=1 Tax=Mesorhizobium ventifaucium TaxID=666020 RepID=A0ABN8JFJ3_9HYPH|nr:hypothetical protein MES4922_180030 [Mesorhizobium ventifaucium]